MPSAGLALAATRCLALAGLVLGGSAFGAPPPDVQIQGTVLPVAPAVTETTSEIMARHERLAVTAPKETLEFFLGRADTSHKKVDPAGEGLTQGPATGPQGVAIASPVGPSLPQPVGVNADGPGSGTSPCGTPPDTMGAVGPTQFISFVNCNIVSYNKATGATDGVLNTTPDNFFNGVRSSSVSDPHVRYDRLSQRWFLVIIDVTFPNNRVLLAVSNTATITPSTIWTFYYFQSANGTHTNCLADYPTPGIDANAIYIGVNQFCGSSLNTASYAGSDGYVVQKSSVLGSGPIHVTAFQNMSDVYTPQGVDNADPAATEGWFLGGSVGFYNRLNLVRVSNPGNLGPTISPTVTITTANQGNPATQPHLGNTQGTIGKLDASDNRPFAATFRNGSLWTAMGVGTTVSGGSCVGVASGTPTRDAVFWWELRGIPTGSTPTIFQSGSVCDTAASNPAFYSYGTITPSGQGHAALGFSVAGATTYVSAGTAGRLSGDTPGALQSINVYGPGAAAYNPSWDTGASYGFRRWGDYSFTSLDPCDDQTLWTMQEYVSVANQYGTRFAQLKAPPPATPASASPSSVAPGQASVNVVLTGTSASGSGFYDTPASLSGEPCRLRIGAVVPGVTVNSVTYTDPTHVTLNLNTTGASAGAKNVTVTNPDGQSTTGSGILTVCSPPATPVVTAPATAGAGSPKRTASVPNHAGSVYVWTIGNGTITAGQGTSQITFTVGAFGSPVTLSVVETNASGCSSAPGSATVTVAPAGSAVLFYTLAPCRVVDTRNANGPLGGPVLAPSEIRTLPVAGNCGIPATAKSISVNIAVVAAASGHFRLYPGDAADPGTAAINFGAGQIRSNNGEFPLASDGSGTLKVANHSGGSNHLILDVNGWFE